MHEYARDIISSTSAQTVGRESVMYGQPGGGAPGAQGDDTYAG